MSPWRSRNSPPARTVIASDARDIDLQEGVRPKMFGQADHALPLRQFVDDIQMFGPDADGGGPVLAGFGPCRSGSSCGLPMKPATKTLAGV